MLKSALGRDITRVILYGIGLGSVSALVYTAGPLIAFGDYRPLDNYIVRSIVILILVAGVGSFGGFKFWKRRKSSEELAQGIADAKEESDAVVLKDKMKDALATLKSASGNKANYLYDLPWYLLIGPPGAGKTTALINSGLKFPLSRGGATPAAIAGVGGTRYCDWWFTEDAVLVDTAGRYTTQDSDAKADQKSWFSFLDLLKKNRPRQPINGVIVAISLEDIMTLSQADLNAHASAIRARLLELHQRLKVDFPVYALFTKGDLVAGFTEFFGYLNEQSRRQVWGATFQTNDKTRNLVGDVPIEFDALVERLNEELTDRLQDEPAPATRVSLFGFPTQMATLKKPIYDFLNQIFEPTRYHANATLRGFYFTSGTQQGTPIDQLIGALVKSFGAEEVAGAAYSGLGKSFFLTDLIKKVIIGEAAWVSTDRAAVRRARIIKAAAYSAMLLVTVGAAAAWWTSYNRNKDLIDRTDAAIADYRAAAGPLATETVVADRDLAKILPLLHKLRHMPTGYAQRAATVPLLATFGLSQRDRLQSSSESAYHIALERLLRARLLYRMEEVLEANRTNPSVIYEALKVYLMLGGLQRADRELILGWMRRDWADNLYPGAANAEGRKALEEHLTAMLDLDTGASPSIELHGPLVEESQKTLARLSLSQRAYELLRSQARASVAPDWLPSRSGGPDFALVFQPVGGGDLDSVRVPGFYTYAGFHRAFVDRLGSIAEQIKQERWVLGAAGEQQAVTAQYDRLGQDLLDLYARDFIAAWRNTLGRLQFKPLTVDRPKYVALSAVGAATSPLKQLLESIRDETALTRERPGFGKAPAGGGAGTAQASEPTPALLRQQGQAPGATIEAAFKAFHVLVEGDSGRRPIDAIVANLNEINQSLTTLATNPALQAQANAQLQQQVAGLRANAARLPPPFADMLIRAAGTFEGDLTSSAHAQLRRALGDQVTGVCQQIAPDRYPLVRGATREVPLVEFGRLFAPNGVMDRFFTQNLASLVDTSRREWTYRQESPLARALAPATLREFQRAAQIRDAFFATGGSMPSINMVVTPPPMAAAPPPPPPTPTPGFGQQPPPQPQPQGPGPSIKLDINGTVVESKPGASAPQSVQWPGAGTNRFAITVTQDSMFGSAGVAPATFERSGVWALFRALEQAQPRGDRLVANFFVGGRDVQYQFTTGSSLNPFTLPALREFRCPTGI
jgi:type VI secretion system protein ImpL